MNHIPRKAQIIATTAFMPIIPLSTIPVANAEIAQSGTPDISANQSDIPKNSQSQKPDGQLATVSAEEKEETIGEEAEKELRSQAITYNRKVINKSKTQDWTDYSQRIASCKGAGSGINCSLSNSYTPSRTVGLDLGISRSGVTGALKISNRTSQTVTVSCSKTVKQGQTLSLYPRGDRHKYKIQRQTISTAGTVIKTDVSGWKYAFDPGRNDYTCAVQ